MLLQRYHEMNKLFRKVEIEGERMMEEKNSLEFSTNDANASKVANTYIQLI